MGIFDQETLNRLFKITGNGYLKRRETYTLEFKQDFDWSNKKTRVKYLRSFAAFANNKGGYILFGIENNPHTIKGIKGFDKIDESDISSSISTYFSSDIHFERTIHEVDGKEIGIIYIYESKNKPIVCIKSYDSELHSSYIYYRYRGKSSQIKAGDLINLINDIKQQISNKWLNLFQNVGKIGIDKVGILDPDSGTLSSKGKDLIVDESILDQLNVIDEYESDEKEGAPAYRIVGDIQKSAKVVSRSKVLHDEDIIKGYLENRSVGQPIEYVKAICYCTSGYFPVYYYIGLARLKIDETIKMLKDVKKSSFAKKYLLGRLNGDDKLSEKYSMHKVMTKTDAGDVRWHYYKILINSNPIDITSQSEAKRCLEAILNLREGIYDNEYVKRILLDLFDKYYSTSLSSLLRYAISYLDLMENRYRVE